MSKLYISNCTRQVQEIQFRLDFNQQGQPQMQFRPALRQTIQPGRQVIVANKDLHQSQVDSIVGQLCRYGMIAVADVPRTKSKTALVYNVDRPVSSEVIRTVMARNAGVLLQEGKERRQKAALATNEIIATAVTNNFAAMGIPKEPTQDVDVEFEQEEQTEAGESRIEEGFRIRDNAPSTSPPQRNTKQRRRAA